MAVVVDVKDYTRQWWWLSKFMFVGGDVGNNTIRVIPCASAYLPEATHSARYAFSLHILWLVGRETGMIR